MFSGLDRYRQVRFLSGLKLNSAGQWPSKTEVAYPWCKVTEADRLD